MFEICQLIIQENPQKRKQLLQLLGMRAVPPILHGDISTPLEDRGLEEYRNGIDNLHNGVGIIKLVLDLERKSPGWNEWTFLFNLAKRIGVSSN